MQRARQESGPKSKSFQGVVPYAYLTIIIGLTRDEKKSLTYKFFTNPVLQRVYLWSVSVYWSGARNLVERVVGNRSAHCVR